jgi:hypothetical protein
LIFNYLCRVQKTVCEEPDQCRNNLFLSFFSPVHAFANLSVCSVWGWQYIAGYNYLRLKLQFPVQETVGAYPDWDHDQSVYRGISGFIYDNLSIGLLFKPHHCISGVYIAGPHSVIPVLFNGNQLFGAELYFYQVICRTVPFVSHRCQNTDHRNCCWI